MTTRYPYTDITSSFTPQLAYLLYMRRWYSAMASSLPKRFAPLQRISGQPPSQAPLLRGVVFDMDGTLWYGKTPCYPHEVAP